MLEPPMGGLIHLARELLFMCLHFMELLDSRLAFCCETLELHFQRGYLLQKVEQIQARPIDPQTFITKTPFLCQGCLESGDSLPPIDSCLAKVLRRLRKPEADGLPSAAPFRISPIPESIHKVGAIFLVPEVGCHHGPRWLIDEAGRDIREIVGVLDPYGIDGIFARDFESDVLDGTVIIGGNHDLEPSQLLLPGGDHARKLSHLPALCASERILWTR
jgi:hypothetical protein